MVPADYDWGFDFSLFYQVIHRQPELRPLAVAQPADARRQPLKFDSFSCQVNPASQNAVVWKQLQHQVVGYRDIGRIARQRDPAEGASSFAKEWSDIRRHKSGKIVSVLHSALESKCADVISVVKSYRAHFLQAQHAF